MFLEDLLRDVETKAVHAEAALELAGLCTDSREVMPGAAFVAVSGFSDSGYAYIEQARAAGAALVICEQPPEIPMPYVLVSSARAALPVLAANYYGRPAERMTMIGVTGTNGKTSVTYLLRTILETVPGSRVGLIGTTGNRIGEELLPAERTTPDVLQLHRLLARMAASGCTHVVMEVSSHALMLNRVDGIRFRCGVFTNLTPEHLDFHKTMEDYRAAKGRLFAQSDCAVLNLDDAASHWYLERLACPACTYSENKDAADLTAKNIRLFPDRVEFEAVAVGEIARMELPIPGGFSIYNALAALSCGMHLGLRLGDMAAALRTARGVPGRMERVPVPADFTVLIDYAHTPDALENLLLTVREMVGGRVILLFGCGGDRDRSKRPLMGALAAQLSDVAVVTSDNPRTESPQGIIDEILAGMDGGAQCHVEADRRAAISLALSMARTGDIVVLAGKGHETDQAVGMQSHHLDEREEVADYFARISPTKEA